MYLGLDRAHFLSPTGQCKPFDDSADGYCRSEGCAAFVIKKLGDAISEGDRILGVIRGTEINQSGNAHSITHPHSQTQEELFQTLLKKTQIHPHQVRHPKRKNYIVRWNIRSLPDIFRSIDVIGSWRNH
jgi:acyl transferase domain-containing protein